MTVVEALKNAGYYSSYNYNAAFYTLADIPEFDDYGLWTHQDRRFSIHRTLTETLCQLVDHSTAGYSPSELGEILGVECRALLSQLARKDRLHREAEGRHYVYLSLECARQAQQKEARFGGEPVLVETALPLLPPGLDARSVIRALVVAIMEPKASPRQLAARLRREGTFLTAQGVREVFSFYELREKRGS